MTHPNETSLTQLYDAIQLTRPLLRHITATVETTLDTTGISVGERAILEAISQLHRATAPILTDKLQLKRQFVARILAGLSTKSLIVSHPNAAHKRSPIYGLSPKGAGIIDNIRKKEMALLREFANQFSEQEIAAHHKMQHALNIWFSKLAEKGE